MKTFTCHVDHDPKLLKAHERVRYSSLGIHLDGLDSAKETTLITCYDADEAVAAARLIVPCEEYAREHDLALGLPIARDFTIHLDGPVGEVSLLCVRATHQGSLAVWCVLQTILDESRSLGLRYLVSRVPVGTDDPEDVELALRVLAAMGRLVEPWAPREGPRARRGSGRPAFYSAAQHARAAGGDLDLPLPAPLRLSVLAGARFLGEPVRDGTGAYSLVSVVTVAEAEDFVPDLASRAA